jgi:hypothetical protein
MQRPTLALSPLERAFLKSLIEKRALTDALQYLRAVAQEKFIQNRTQITEDDLIFYLATWQKILDNSKKD